MRPRPPRNSCRTTPLRPHLKDGNINRYFVQIGSEWFNLEAGNAARLCKSSLIPISVVF